MTDNLKTLKDLVWDERGKGHPEDLLVTQGTLRQEAIKWVKWCREMEKKEPQTKLAWDTLRNGFQNFFNISEEDLQ